MNTDPTTDSTVDGTYTNSSGVYACI